MTSVFIEGVYPMNNKTKTFVRAALFAAITAVATMVIAIPLPGGGYANLGDAVVLLSAFFLPAPYAAVAAGLGAGLADVLLSYTLYAPATFVIKALMALCAGALARGKMGRIVAAVLAECIMVGGYFIFETALYGVAGAVPALAGNSVQGIVGAVAALILFHCLNPILNRKEK